MSVFSDQIERRKQMAEKTKNRKDKLAIYFYDASKLVLAGVVIGGLSPIYTNQSGTVNINVVLIGFVATVILAWIGNKILK